MRRYILSAFLCALISAPTFGMQQVPATGRAMITTVTGTTPGFSTAVGQPDFQFTIDTPVTFSGPQWSCLTNQTNNWFGIPKHDPLDLAVPQTKDNPGYRDQVNVVMLANALGRTVVLWVDGCVNGLPRVVGVQLFP